MFDQSLKDSGTRRNFDTGAVRDAGQDKGRMDLLPPDALIALSKHFEKGSKKYQERNWEKGIPYSRYIDSGLRHAMQALNGETDEPHVIAAAWNFLCLAQTMIWVEKGILPSTLDDLPHRLAGPICNCPEGGPHDEMCPVCIAHASLQDAMNEYHAVYDEDEYGAPEGAGDSVAYTGTGPVPPAAPAVSDEDVAAMGAYEKAARTVFGDYLDKPFADEGSLDTDEDPNITAADFHYPSGTDPDRLYYWDGIGTVSWIGDLDTEVSKPYSQEEARLYFSDGRWVRNEELPPGTEIDPHRVRRFALKDPSDNPDLAIMEFIGEKGEFVYRNGNRCSIEDWRLSDYDDNDDTWIEL